MTAAKSIKVFVVIVTWNAERWLKQCIGCLAESRLPVDVIVVDNDSTDATVSRIETDYPSVILIRSASNLGFGKANNAGIARALELGAEYVFLLNQDAWIEPGTIDTLVEIAERNPAFYVLSPLQFTAGFRALDHSFSRYASPDNCPELLSDMAAMVTLKDGYPTSFVNAALWLISRRCLETVGGFDPLFNHYGEDYDYVHRVRFFHRLVVICPMARGVHDRDQQPYVLSKIADPERRYYRMKVDMLISLKDINRKFFKTLLKESRHNLSGLLKSLLMLRPGQAMIFAKLLTFALRLSPAIVRSRAVCRESGGATDWICPEIPLKH